jgi:site-specific DNA recombinase
VLQEFVDAGESAKSADRPSLQLLVAFVHEHQPDYVIVHKIDRLARNRSDDVMINLELQSAGARLVSCTENIDETPSGKLLHGIMASIAEFYSANLGTEALKGMRQKAQQGGTTGKAPLGYLNVGKLIDGREIRTIEIDSIRAPIVCWAFEAYASGDWTLKQLLPEVTARGLTTIGTRARVEKPLALSVLHRMLRNRYYIGKVSFKEVEYDGSHQHLVSLETFTKVQTMLDARRAGGKEREHHHYLKGTIYCGACGSRLCVTRTVNRHGTEYLYFFCVGRHQRRMDCVKRSVAVSVVESYVEREWASIRIDAKYGALLQELVQTELDALQQENEKTERQVGRQLELRRSQRKKLLDAYYSGAISVDILKTEQQSLTREIESLELRLMRTHLKVAELEHVLRRTLEFLYRPQEAYRAAPPALRRQLNQAVWEQILIFDNEPVASGTVSEPFATLLDPDLVVPVAATPNPAAVASASWVAGRPGWIDGHIQSYEREHLGRARAQRRGKGLKDGHLAAPRGRHSNPHPPLGVGLKEGGLAPPTGFEPVLPP